MQIELPIQVFTQRPRDGQINYVIVHSEKTSKTNYEENSKTCIQIEPYVYIYIYIYTHTHMHIYAYICLHINAYIHTHIHIHTHTYIHTSL